MVQFDKRGMMLFPVPKPMKEFAETKSLLVIEKCFCQHAHSLVSNRVVFDDFSSILLKARKGAASGLVALSPVYGLKHKATVDIRLVKDELLELCCPECSEPLPVYSPCSCGGNLIALFLDTEASFANIILICNRVGCYNSRILYHNETFYYDGVDRLMFI